MADFQCAVAVVCKLLGILTEFFFSLSVASRPGIKSLHRKRVNLKQTKVRKLKT